MGKWLARLRELQSTDKTDETVSSGQERGSSVSFVGESQATDPQEVDGSVVVVGEPQLTDRHLAGRTASQLTGGSATSLSADKTDVPASQQLSRLVDCELRTQARDLVAVAEMYTLGSMLNWCELPVAPGVTLMDGEDAWTRFLRFPPPGALPVALEAAKSKVEQEYPF